MTQYQKKKTESYLKRNYDDINSAAVGSVRFGVSSTATAAIINGLLGDHSHQPTTMNAPDAELQDVDSRQLSVAPPTTCWQQRSRKRIGVGQKSQMSGAKQ